MLTLEQIEQLWCEYPSCEIAFARAIEAEVRKQDDELIQQMLEALETAGVYPPSSQAAITAARARLGEKT